MKKRKKGNSGKLSMKLVWQTKKEAVISLAEMGVPLQQITQGVKVEEKTVHKWLNEKKNMKTTY